MIGHTLIILATLAIGFGAGRVHHPSNLKIEKIRQAIAKFEAAAVSDAHAVVAKIKSIL